MKLKLNFPKDLYSDVRVEENYSIWFSNENGEVDRDGDCEKKGAMIRVFDGELWYTASTNDLNGIQEELDSLAKLAKPNPDIYENPEIKLLEVNKDSVFKFTGENDVRNYTRNDFKELVDYYIDNCIDCSIPEMNFWNVAANAVHFEYSFYSSKGAEIEYDSQETRIGAVEAFTVDGATTYGYKIIMKPCFEELKGHEEAVNKKMQESLNYAKNAVDVEPGDYCCVLAPFVTAMFTHESFGHKSESDFMLNDKTLQDEWVMGKKVGTELVSICDDGSLNNHGYKPYDDQGTKARETWLIKDGVLTGRLHDAQSASILNEELTGNCRAQDYTCTPVVRMTNTYMKGGTTPIANIFDGIKDGIFVADSGSGTGQAMFTIRPNICYRIRDGKVCEPVRVNVINGNVFKTLFDIEAIADDFVLCNELVCGKSGQSVPVSAGGPTIRVKSLTVN
ncbi:MAG: TldD/PmbA family protein [Lachnospiraceae bacterium]|nr:TldD/PmbA family protein [Lachnospiraceae bacterium]